MRGKWAFMSVAVALIAVAASAFWLLRRERTPKATPRANAAADAALTEISLPGIIQAQHVISVGAKVTGQIESFLVDVGQEVYEGQLLARISNAGLETGREMALEAMEKNQTRVSSLERAVISARLEASRARAEAMRTRSDFDSAERAYRRQQMLHSEGATPRLLFEKAEKEFRSAETEYRSRDELARQAEERVTQLLDDLQTSKVDLEEKRKHLEEVNQQLSATEVHSPVNGIVVARKGEVGQRLRSEGEGEDLFQIAVNLSDLEVVLDAEPALLKQMRAGQPALILVADLPGEGITGTVKKVEEKQLIISFVSPSSVLKPGMTAQVKLHLGFAAF